MEYITMEQLALLMATIDTKEMKNLKTELLESCVNNLNKEIEKRNDEKFTFLLEELFETLKKINEQFPYKTLFRDMNGNNYEAETLMNEIHYVTDDVV